MWEKNQRKAIVLGQLEQCAAEIYLPLKNFISDSLVCLAKFELSDLTFVI